MPAAGPFELNSLKFRSDIYPFSSVVSMRNKQTSDLRLYLFLNLNSLRWEADVIYLLLNKEGQK